MHQRAHAPVVLAALRLRIAAPRVVTAVMNGEHRAQAPNRVMRLLGLNERVLHPDCLAKYVAAFLRNTFLDGLQ